MTALAIVIPILIIAAAVVGFAAYKRRDRADAVGRLSRETRSRDRGDAKWALHPAFLRDRHYSGSKADTLKLTSSRFEASACVRTRRLFTENSWLDVSI